MVSRVKKDTNTLEISNLEIENAALKERIRELELQLSHVQSQ